MGYLREKYTREYFLGRDESGNRLAYGVAGYEEWVQGRVYADIERSLLRVDWQGRNVLEIGFGRAESARYILEHGAVRYVGIDFSPAACELARTTLAGLCGARYELIDGDALEIMRERGYEAGFDAVLMLDVIEHVPTTEVRQLLPLIHRAIKPGGDFLVHTPFYALDEDLIAQGGEYRAPSVSDLIPETRGMHCNKFTRVRFHQELLQAGFEPLSDRHFRCAPL